MARKSAELVKPVKLSASSVALIRQMRRVTPVEGCEGQWERHVTALETAELEHAKLDVIFKQVEREGGTSSCKSWPVYLAQLAAVDRATHAVLGSCDSYVFATKHVSDKIGMAVEEFDGVIFDSLEDKLAGFKFDMSKTRLATAIAEAVRLDVQEFDAGDPVLCEDCA